MQSWKKFTATEQKGKTHHYFMAVDQQPNLKLCMIIADSVAKRANLLKFSLSSPLSPLQLFFKLI